MKSSRFAGFVVVVLGLVLAATAGAQAPKRGGVLVVAMFPEPPMLTSALTTAGAVAMVSPKIFDGLLKYDFDFNPQPQLAESWTVAPDGKSITFRLRKGVKWHDGHDFSSADVQFSVMEIWKKFHGRGRATFANVDAVDTPDANTAILRLGKPAPYIMNALAAMESQVVAKHIYEGKDPQTNPVNNTPVGTGPFRFVKWERGSHIELERNNDYWDKGKPYLDKIVFRIIPDSAARAAALEANEVQIVGMNQVPLNEVRRLSRLAAFGVETRGYQYLAIVSAFEFNLEKPMFQDRRVRQAFAHAIDRNFITQTIWLGYGKPAVSYFHPDLGKAYSADVPQYPFDLKKAEQLLDEAGFKRGPDGIRMRITHDFMPFGEPFVRTAEYLKQALGKIGVAVDVRSQDFGAYVRRIYTDRDFDTTNYYANTGPDPSIAVQRFYWSKSLQKGVAFSNGAAYKNPDMDKLLEAAQVETDAGKRIRLFHEIQKLAATDLPMIPLTAVNMTTVYRRTVHNHTTTAEGFHANFAEVWLDGK